MGGNAIQFAFTCERVIAVDIDAERLAIARHNARVYGVEDRISFVHADFLDQIIHRVVSAVRVRAGRHQPSGTVSGSIQLE